MPQLFTVRFLVSALLALGLGASAIMATFSRNEPVTIELEPPASTTILGETFTVKVVVNADIPVNAYSGLFRFDPQLLSITKIDYNTSIADLWVTEPWYSNGDGTFSFAGGTTAQGGFSGAGTLLTITFTSLAPGDSHLTVDELQVLQHDGLGTEVAVDKDSIDGLFTIEETSLDTKVVSAPTQRAKNITVLPPERSPDLNADGEVSLADISIFMQHLATQNQRSDFNYDEKISTKDLSILLQAR